MSEFVFEDEREKENFRKSVEEHNQKIKKMKINNEVHNGCTIEHDACYGINDNNIDGQFAII